MFSAFILAPRLNAVVATEHRTAADVRNQPCKRSQGQSDVQQVDHVVLGEKARNGLARYADHTIRRLPLRLYKERGWDDKDFTKEAGARRQSRHRDGRCS